MSKPELDVSNIAALAPGTAVHAKGKQRVHDIVHTATRVLAFDGYSKFTMRGIAAKTGISLKNLQYYFPTKDSLFQAVIEQRIREDLASARRVVKRQDLSAQERFVRFVDLSLEENTTPLIRGLQFELWALANYDAFAARCRDQMTSAYCEFIYDLIRELAPQQSASRLKKKSAMLLAMLQGIALITGEGIELEFNVGSIKQNLHNQALKIVLSQDE